MNQRIRFFLILFLFFLSIYAALAYYATSSRPSQPFLGFGVYSEKDTLSSYTDPGTAIVLNVTYDWKLNVTNEMGTTQFVQILSLLGNGTTLGPNATSFATLQPLSNSTLFVANRNFAIQDFKWAVTNVTASNGLDYLTININGEEVRSNLGTLPGSPFRFYFELWTFNTSPAGFQYYTWLQIAFIVKT